MSQGVRLWGRETDCCRGFPSFAPSRFGRPKTKVARHSSATHLQSLSNCMILVLESMPVGGWLGEKRSPSPACPSLPWWCPQKRKSYLCHPSLWAKRPQSPTSLPSLDSFSYLALFWLFCLEGFNFTHRFSPLRKEGEGPLQGKEALGTFLVQFFLKDSKFIYLFNLLDFYPA